MLNKHLPYIERNVCALVASVSRHSFDIAQELTVKTFWHRLPIHVEIQKLHSPSQTELKSAPAYLRYWQPSKQVKNWCAFPCCGLSTLICVSNHTPGLLLMGSVLRSQGIPTLLIENKVAFGPPCWRRRIYRVPRDHSQFNSSLQYFPASIHLPWTSHLSFSV